MDCLTRRSKNCGEKKPERRKKKKKRCHLKVLRPGSEAVEDGCRCERARPWPSKRPRSAAPACPRLSGGASVSRWLNRGGEGWPLPACQGTAAGPSGELSHPPPPTHSLIHPCACTKTLLQVPMHVTAALMTVSIARLSVSVRSWALYSQSAATIIIANNDQKNQPVLKPLWH